MSTRMMAGIIKGLQKSQDRYRDIRASRDQRRQEEEEFELKKKKHKTELDILKKQNDNDPILDMLEKQMKDQFDLQEAQSKVNSNMIDNAMRKEEDRMQTLQRTGSKIMRSMPRRNPQLDWSYNTGSRSFSIKPREDSQTKTTMADKVFGKLANGNFADRQEAEEYAQSNLGYGWQSKHPKAIDIIDRTYGFDLPREIGKTSEAVDYLMNEKGMARNEAIQWLRKSNQRTVKVK